MAQRFRSRGLPFRRNPPPTQMGSSTRAGTKVPAGLPSANNESVGSPPLHNREVPPRPSQSRQTLTKKKKDLRKSQGTRPDDEEKGEVIKQGERALGALRLGFRSFHPSSLGTKTFSRNPFRTSLRLRPRITKNKIYLNR